MPKRTTDTEIVNQAWFQDLSAESKLIWFYIEKMCDTAGIYKLDVINMKRILKCDVDIKKFIDEVNRDYNHLTGKPTYRERVRLIDNRKLWVTGYIGFQWGNSDGKIKIWGASKSGIDKLKDHGLYDEAIEKGFLVFENNDKGSEGFETLSKQPEGVKEEVEVKTQSKTKTLKKELKELDKIYSFDQFWEDYPHRKTKVGKKQCLEWWSKNANTEEVRNKIKIGTKAYFEDKKRNPAPGEFISPAKDPIRYLKHEIWSDYFNIRKEEKKKSIVEKWVRTEKSFGSCTKCKGTYFEFYSTMENTKIECDQCGHRYEVKVDESVKKNILESINKIGGT